MWLGLVGSACWREWIAEVSSDALHRSRRNTEVDKVGLPSGVATLYRSPSRSVADMVVCTQLSRTGSAE